MNPFDQITRPTLLIDQARCQANIARMAAAARAARVRFRPHFKTHQSAAVGEWFRQAGVERITVSSVDMAEYFAAHGWTDITIAFSMNVRQVEAVNRLARQVRLGLLVESPETAAFLRERLTADVDAWIKVDVGAGRTGLAWDAPAAAAALAGEVNRGGAHLRLAGLLTHAGHSYRARGEEQIRQVYAESSGRLRGLKAQLEQAGLRGLELSFGDTPCCSVVDDFSGLDEIRPGNFVFFDITQVIVGSCRETDLAVGLACPVVARHPERGQVILYGGAVHLAAQALVENGRSLYGWAALPAGTGWGPAVPGAYLSALSQEHGILNAPPALLEQLHVGDLVIVLPVHSCLTADLMPGYLNLNPPEGAPAWLPKMEKTGP
jgi:D-serine deaminase-like pyridoxal phosphate-dependent protein